MGVAVKNEKRYLAEGAMAYMDGAEPKHNPYPEETKENELWLEGYKKERDFWSKGHTAEWI